jgi:hypothetical protein
VFRSGEVIEDTEEITIQICRRARSNVSEDIKDCSLRRERKISASADLASGACLVHILRVNSACELRGPDRRHVTPTDASEPLGVGIVLFVNGTRGRRSGQERNLVVKDVVRFQDTERNASDIENTGAAQRTKCIGKEVQSQTRDWVDQLYQEFRVVWLRQVEVRHEKFIRYGVTNRVGVIGHEVHVFRGNAPRWIAMADVEVHTDGDASGQGDPCAVYVGNELTQAVVQHL